MQTPVPSEPLFLHSYSNSHSDSQIKFYCEQMFNHSKPTGPAVLTCIQPRQAVCMSYLHLQIAALEHAGHVFTEALGKKKLSENICPLTSRYQKEMAGFFKSSQNTSAIGESKNLKSCPQCLTTLKQNPLTCLPLKLISHLEVTSDFFSLVEK